MTRTDSEARSAARLTPRQIFLIRDSFSSVAPMRKTAATLFHAHLFEMAPSVRPLFSRDVSDQGDMLMAALARIVRALDRMEDVAPDLEALARRHPGYGAREEHYPAVGEALIWALEQALAERFTDEVRKAWVDAYAEISHIMIAATRAGRPSV
ncbi:nitric oxide dioxygenase [Jannaschia faecimaris]|uniref:Nitric oxide dioxygenase n=1 Tax=Jannaschia faecimaris TaxID=1244108 RepID=A0A1H3U9P0_9RHOB|nr:globin family protein [Jannaschia faecimaris]SDZ58289.1 nitric oxide dioxygenase [Jannaschia faecimaris]